ncbi:uncharacterized protein LOC143822418 [Paroedura picta]|uniref:uncharacterized protein LOC143822418 n=1 Tax=Paroedura picta TaxID=143630 RepID=UPI004057AAF5
MQIMGPGLAQLAGSRGGPFGRRRRPSPGAPLEVPGRPPSFPPSPAHLDVLALDLHRLLPEVDADGGLGAGREGSPAEAHRQARLAHVGVADDDDLEDARLHRVLQRGLQLHAEEGGEEAQSARSAGDETHVPTSAGPRPGSAAIAAPMEEEEVAAAAGRHDGRRGGAAGTAGRTATPPLLRGQLQKREQSRLAAGEPPRGRAAIGCRPPAGFLDALPRGGGVAAAGPAAPSGVQRREGGGGRQQKLPAATGRCRAPLDGGEDHKGSGEKHMQEKRTEVGSLLVLKVLLDSDFIFLYIINCLWCLPGSVGKTHQSPEMSFPMVWGA